MRKIKVRQPKRGPKRTAASKVKLRCALKLCKQQSADVKNSPYKLTVSEVDPGKVRPLATVCKTAKFCCKQHRDKARLPASNSRGPVGGREALTPEQALAVFNVFLVDLACPWAAVAFLLALFLGERCFCALQARDNWFVHPESDHPAINIPKVNRKTKPREFPLDKSFAQLLTQWASEGLKGAGGRLWPHTNQQLKLGRTGKFRKGRLLFPGRQLGGENVRNFNQAVSTRAFHYIFVDAQNVIKEQVAKCKLQGTTHAFEDAELSRVTSHSCKKTAVTLMKQQGVATTIISMLTGTSCRVLDTTYFRPTKQAQREAQASAFRGITQGLKTLVELPKRPHQDDSHSGTATELPAAPAAAAARQFCVACGRQTRAEWRFCPTCGKCLHLQEP